VAKRYNLLVTGGSDCHGLNRGKPLIGTVRLPYEYLVKLKERADAIGESSLSQVWAS
jgi:hypothetical protein